MNFEEKWTIDSDMDAILIQCANVWKILDGKSIFITGGTGFIGRWLLESIYEANRKLNITINVTILTRSVEAFNAKEPHLVNCKEFSFVAGDIVDFNDDISGDFDYMIHAATEASASLNETNPRKMFNTIVNGTQNMLDFSTKKSIGKVLFLSSGAIYGQQPWEMKYVSEGWNGSLDCCNPTNTYAEAKRAAEMACSIYAKQFGSVISIARIFSLLGPHLPIDTHFAAGNFIRDSINGKKIIVNGNGLPERSFLYPTDMVVWLLHILVEKKGEVYNIGSDESISIGNLAKLISNTIGSKGFEIRDENDLGWNLGRYVPAIDKIKSNLGVEKQVALNDAIYRTAVWNGWVKNEGI
jgi:nucleoside-diphosphate-sugar epimerase